MTMRAKEVVVVILHHSSLARTQSHEWVWTASSYLIEALISFEKIFLTVVNPTCGGGSAEVCTVVRQDFSVNDVSHGKRTAIQMRPFCLADFPAGVMKC